MKNAKRFLALVLAVAMILTSNGVVFAANEVAEAITSDASDAVLTGAEEAYEEPAQVVEPEPEPEPAPVVVEPEPEPEPEPAPVVEPEPTPEPEPAPVVEPEPAPEPEPEPTVEPEPAPEPAPEVTPEVTEAPEEPDGGDQMPETPASVPENAPESAAEATFSISDSVAETTDPVLTSKTFNLGVSGLSIEDDPEHAGAFVVTFDGTEYKNVSAGGEIVLTGNAGGNTAYINTTNDIAVRLKDLRVNSAASAIVIGGRGNTKIIVEGRNVLQSNDGVVIIGSDRVTEMVESSNDGYLYAYSGNGYAIRAGRISFNVPTAANGIQGEITIKNENVNSPLRGAHLYKAVVTGLDENMRLSGFVTVDGEKGTVTIVKG